MGRAGGRRGEGRDWGRATQLLRAWRRRRASVCAPPDRWNDFETGSGTVASSRRRTIDGVGASVAFVGAPVGASGCQFFEPARFLYLPYTALQRTPPAPVPVKA